MKDSVFARARGPVLSLAAAGLAAGLLAAATVARADAPAGYYSTVDATSSATLRATVHAVIKAGHVKIPYTAASTDTWNVLELADEDPLNSGRIIDVYKNTSYIKYGAGNSEYDREHTWPKSFGFPDDGSSVLPYSDCHMLFLSNSSYNSSRSNNVYDTCTTITQSYATANYNGEVGVNYRMSATPEGRWETWTGRRGDVARALLYFDVRYEGEGSEPDLILTDDINLIVGSNTGVNMDVAYMGILTTLLQWHAQDPVSDRERNRNDVVYTYQGNRNPFIDQPEWVSSIWGPSASVEEAWGRTIRTWVLEGDVQLRGLDAGQAIDVRVLDTMGRTIAHRAAREDGPLGTRLTAGAYLLLLEHQGLRITRRIVVP